MTDFTATLDTTKYRFRECIYCFGIGSVKNSHCRYGRKKCSNCSGNGYTRTLEGNHQPTAAFLR